MNLHIEFSHRAFKTLEKSDPQTKKRVLEKLKELRENPFPRGCRRVKGETHVYRLRVGDKRILYKILWDEEVALIFKIEHRRRVYGSSQRVTNKSK